MANQIVVSAGAKVRNLDGVLTGTSGVVNSLPINASNGIPQLDVNGKILVSQLPNSVMEYQGVWNANTNTPTLTNGGAFNQGDVYLCNVAGTTNFGAGPISFIVGDQAIYSGTIWQKAGGATGTVTSVAITESGDSLNITGSPITTSGTINIGFNGTNLQYVNGAGNLTTFPTLITSIGLSMPSAFSVANSPLTANGTIAVTGAGYASQYIRGDGTLADFPSSGGGGSSVSYYLNGGTSQGTIGGVTYYEMSKTADTGTGVDFTKSGDGFIVAFLTDANDPALLNIPAGNWNYEIYASMSANGGTPQMYAELYKYDGTTFTLISTSSNEILYDGTNLNLYTFGMTVPATTLALTDRLAIKLYATNSGGKTTTVHTQDSHLCQVITTFSTGITALNGLTAQVQYFQTGTSGTDFNISSTTATHTFNLPTASATNRGALSSADWSIFNGKQPQLNGTGFVKASGTTITYDNSTYYLASNPSAFIALTALSAGVGISYNNTTGVITNSAPDQTVSLTASTGISVTGTYPNFTITNTSPSSGGTVTSVAALTIGTTGTDLSSSVANSTTTPVITLNVPTASATNRGALSSTDWLTFNGKIGGGGTANYIPKFSGTFSIADSIIYDNSGNVLINTTDSSIGHRLAVYSATEAAQLRVMGLAPSVLFTESTTNTNSYSAYLGVVTSVNNFYTGSFIGDFVMSNNSNYGIAFAINNSQKLRIANTGAATFTSSVTATSFVKTSGTSSQYLMADGSVSTLTNPVTGTGSTNYLPKFTGASTIGNSQVFDDGAVGISNTTPSSYYNSQLVVGNDAAGYGSMTMATTSTGINSIFFSRSSSGAGRYRGSISYVQSTDAINFRNSGDLLRMTLDASGNLGLGVTPSAWVDYKVLQFGGGSISSYTDNNFFEVNQNAFWNGSFKYVNNGFASRYQQNVGQHQWYNAPNNTSGAGAAITFTQAMTLTAAGRLLINTPTESTYQLDVNGTGRFSGTLSLTNASNSILYLKNTATNGKEWNFQSYLDGTLYIGVSGLATYPLTIASTGAATFSSSVTANTTITAGNGTTNAGLYINRGAASNDNAVRFQTAGTNNWFLGSAATSTNTDMQLYNYGTSSAAMTILYSNNNVLIGTTTNTNHKLTVYNATSASQVRVAGAAPSIVFTDTVTDPANYVGYIGMATAANNFITGTAAGDYVLHNYSGGPILFGINNAERMRINSAGVVQIGGSPYSGNNIKLFVVGQDSTSSNYGIYVQNLAGTPSFYTRNDGNINTGLAAASPYNNTSASSANLIVFTDGSLGRSTSSLKYKNDIRDYNKGLTEVLQMRPVYYKGKNDGDKQFAGLIAEEIHDLGLTEFVQYAQDGSPDALAYQNMIALAFKAIQEQQKQIEELKLKIK